MQHELPRTYLRVGPLIIGWKVDMSVLDFTCKTCYSICTMLGRVDALSTNKGSVSQSIHLLL